MKDFRFLSPALARRFARNARTRGYAVKVSGPIVTVDRVDAQMRALVRRHAAVPVEGAR